MVPVVSSLTIIWSLISIRIAGLVEVKLAYKLARFMVSAYPFAMSKKPRKFSVVVESFIVPIPYSPDPKNKHEPG